jgi:hypothetical protein
MREITPVAVIGAFAERSERPRRRKLQRQMTDCWRWSLHKNGTPKKPKEPGFHLRHEHRPSDDDSCLLASHQMRGGT